MVVPGGTEDEQLRYGRTAGGDKAWGGSGGQAEVQRLGAGIGSNRGGEADSRGGCVDGLMAKMADRATVGGRVYVMVPDHAERRPQKQRQERHGEYETPDFLSVGHILGRVGGAVAGLLVATAVELV